MKIYHWGKKIHDVDIDGFLRLIESGYFKKHGVYFSSECNLRKVVNYESIMPDIMVEREARRVLIFILNDKFKRIYKNKNLKCYIDSESVDDIYNINRGDYSYFRWRKSSYLPETSARLAEFYYNFPLLKFCSTSRQNTQRCVEYWLVRGWSRSRAIEKIKEIQSKNGKLSVGKHIPINNSVNIEYWLARFPEDEAKRRYKERQCTFSLKLCIEKHGEKNGKKIWQERQHKWQKTILGKTDEELADINRRKGKSKEYFINKYGQEYYTNLLSLKCRTFGGASKESIVKFSNITKFLDANNINYYIGAGDRKEWFLRNDTNIYFYDLTIITEKNKIIVEYHGSMFHAGTHNKHLKFPFGLTWENMKKKDKAKKEVALSAGYEYFELWDYENPQKIEEIIHDRFG